MSDETIYEIYRIIVRSNNVQGVVWAYAFDNEVAHKLSSIKYTSLADQRSAILKLQGIWGGRMEAYQIIPTLEK